VLRARPEKVYRAFLDADALPKWLPPNGFTCRVHHLDDQVGGTHKMSFTELVPGEPRPGTPISGPESCSATSIL
jgi:uncharacterized protein YndB with AHSA1/START domain